MGTDMIYVFGVLYRGEGPNLSGSSELGTPAFCPGRGPRVRWVPIPPCYAVVKIG